MFRGGRDLRLSHGAIARGGTGAGQVSVRGREDGKDGQCEAGEDEVVRVLEAAGAEVESEGECGEEMREEVKVWGLARHVFASEKLGVSILDVKAGGYSSWHLHRDRDNGFVCVSAVIDVYTRVDGGVGPWHRLNPGDQVKIAAGVVHKFECLQPGTVIEIYTPRQGASVREDDIERLDMGGCTLEAA